MGITAPAPYPGNARGATLLAGIRAGETPITAFPGACSRHPVACMVKAEPHQAAHSLTVAGAAQAGGVLRGEAPLPASR